MASTLAAATAAAAASTSFGVGKYSSLPDIDTDGADVFETPEGLDSNAINGDDLFDDGSPHLGGAAAVSEDIDQTALNALLAKKRFRGASALDGRAADFSGSLRRQPQTRYPLPRINLETTEYSLLPRGYSTSDTKGKSPGVEEETALQRLRRLRFEVQELEEELEASSEAGAADGVSGASQSVDADAVAGRKTQRPPAPTPAQLLTQLQHLRRDLAPLATAIGEKEEDDGGQLKDRQTKAQALIQQLSTSQPIGDGRAPSPSAGKVLPAVPPGTGPTAASLDARLTTLETLLGSSALLQASASGDTTLPPPLLATLGKIDHQLSLLSQPRHLDSISRRVKALVTDLERVHEARRKLGDSRPLSIALGSGITVASAGSGNASGPPVTSLPGIVNPSGGKVDDASTLPPDALQKLDALFNLLPRIDPLIPLVPHLLARLRSLAGLHASAADFADQLEELKQHVAGLGERGKALEEVLKGVSGSLDENEKTVKTNLQVVEERVSALVERLDRLQG